MKTTLYQLASRVDVGSPMHRRRYRRMQKLNQHIETPTRFDAHLRQQRHKTEQRPMMPPTVEDKTGKPPMMPPTVEDKTGQPPMMPPTVEDKTGKPPTLPPTPPPTPPSSNALRTAYRKGYMHGFKHMRKIDPHANQSQMGWVTTRLSGALAHNPFMAENEIEALVESLLAAMPGYEGEN